MKALWIVLTVLIAGTVVWSTEDLAIESFDSSGQLTFRTLPLATEYRVEWSSSPDGPWTNSWSTLNAIEVRPRQQQVTCAVPMHYRVVATVTPTNPPPPEGMVMVVDLSAGSSASEYPVTYYGTLADLPAAANSDVYKTTHMLMRLIPKGTFTMGSPTGELGRDSEESQHQVTLTQDFYMGVFEVTQKQWERVMGNWPSWFNNASYRDARPVEQVSYNEIRGLSAGAGWPANGNVDADSFMGRLRARTGKVFDLPTESQWEYAGRAGTTTALNSGYNLTSTGSDARMDEVGRYWYNGGSGVSQGVDTSMGTAKVGSYLGNQWGLYDIHGNVWEWCLDWYGTYPGTVTDPVGLASGSYRVRRGGGLGNGANRCRVGGRRGYDDPNFAYGNIGFRACVLSGQQ